MRTTQNPQAAFTLIELLVVVTVIAILAAIALPNFLEAQTRAKVSRVRADFSTLATSLEMYFVDLNTYPMDGNGGAHRGLVALTTPIAYQTSLARDPFNRGYIDGYAAVRTDPDTERNSTHFYQLGTGSIVNPARGFPAQVWAVASYGPDTDDDTDAVGAYPFTKRAVPYDPTNGSISDGDLYRMRPDRGTLNYRADVNPLTF